MNKNNSTAPVDQIKPTLRRVLGLWDLVFYGIVLIQPIAAIGLFGIASKVSHGHMVTTLMIAMVGMGLTALSYGRMAAKHPTAGSAYIYVGKGLNTYLGFMAGWVMFLDYLIVPVINTIYGSLTLARLIPSVPFVIWALLFIVSVTLINLRGIRTTARSNEILLAVMTIVIIFFIVLSIKYIYSDDGWAGLFSFKPFYNPEKFNFAAVMTATSFAALTYIGFDGVTTLAEDVKNPKKNMLLAPVLVCIFTGLFSGLQIYLAQRVWPDYNAFPNLETAFYDVAERVGGKMLFNAIAAILFIACFGSAVAGQVGASRLLFSMGRDGVLPKKIFGQLNKKSNTPTNNIIIMGGLTVIGALALDYRTAAELLNFGAFLAFMGVNIATFRQFYFLRPTTENRNIFFDMALPLLGFLVCFAIWISLPGYAKILGSIWFVIGFIYLIIKTKSFKEKPVMFDFSDM
jgi:putrescine importer